MIRWLVCATLLTPPCAPAHARQHELVGIASFYHYPFHGRKTASGERYNMHAMTAAHKTLPFGTMVRVQIGGRSCVVRITDRGPFKPGRVVDLSLGAAKQCGLVGRGVAPARLQIM